MKTKVIILPLDGYGSGEACLAALKKVLATAGVIGLVSHIKLNDAIHNFDFGGPALVREIRIVLSDLGIEIFLDLKIFDVSATMENVLKKYTDYPPDILTVSSACSIDGIIKLRKLFPQTRLAMVSALTDVDADECLTRYGMTPQVKIFNDLQNIRFLYKKKVTVEDNLEPFDLVVCSPHELTFLKKNLPDTYGFIVPGIRDAWMKKANEHQKRITGVGEALDMGATYVVMGAQMTKGNPELNISAEESRKLTLAEIDKARPSILLLDDPLTTLRNFGGYYKSPVGADGSYLGPLVAYAGTYDSFQGSAVYHVPSDKNFVGFEYFNFARAERNPTARRYFAGLIGEQIKQKKISFSVIIGAPMGGIKLSDAISDYLDVDSIFAEKKVVKSAQPDAGLKETSQLIIDRYSLNQGDKVIICEDVCNNFSTTEKMQTLIENFGAELVAIVCAFNRSGKTDWNGIPVLAACYKPTEQFKQEDEKVAKMIAEGNIIWKPKLEWEKLVAVTEQNQ